MAGGVVGAAGVWLLFMFFLPLFLALFLFLLLIGNLPPMFFVGPAGGFGLAVQDGNDDGAGPLMVATATLASRSVDQ